jgi:hypothetical protein
MLCKKKLGFSEQCQTKHVHSLTESWSAHAGCARGCAMEQWGSGAGARHGTVPISNPIFDPSVRPRPGDLQIFETVLVYPVPDSPSFLITAHQPATYSRSAV